MKKQEILKRIDNELLDKLMGFSYVRTRDSYEAEELCSDIVYELIKSGNKEGEIFEFYGFVWKIAHNVYADFTEKKDKLSKKHYEGNPEEIFSELMAPEQEDDNLDDFNRIIKAISFLTKAYRDVMVLYYFEEKPIAQISKLLNVSDTAVRQRLFAARDIIRKEVLNMYEAKKPVILDKIDYEIIGTGSPAWGDPRDVCTRQMSKHIVWMCYKKPKTAKEISTELNIPMPYVEEELEILTKGSNGEYGLLRAMGNGKYGINFVLFDKDDVEKLHKIYTDKLSEISAMVIEHFEKYRDKYLSLTYINENVPYDLVIWHNCIGILHLFSGQINRFLHEKFFADINEVSRPFSVFGYVDNGKYYGCGCDGIHAENLCGYKKVFAENIYITKLKEHFHCNHNMAQDKQLQLAIKAINGIDVNDILEEDKEAVAKAIECGYLYKKNNMIFTKILALDLTKVEYEDEFYRIRGKFVEDNIQLSENIAKEIGEALRVLIPDYLINEYRFGNSVAGLPLFDGVYNTLIDKGYIKAPKNGIGAEGCWLMLVKE